ncbi:MAG: hypothetical protein ACE14L_07985 [Terriglobales bacterium]
MTSLVCAGQGATNSADTNSELLQRLAALEKRVAELERAGTCNAVTPADSPTVLNTAASAGANSSPHPGRNVDPQQKTTAATVANADQEFGPALKLRGFADLNFGASNLPQTRSGFLFGEFVLHFSSKLSSKISAFAELSVEAQPEGWAIDLERAQIRYDVNDAFKVSFGRYHTPINYWNTAYHHGTWLQTTVSRPRMVDFDGPYLPAHFVGLQVEGSLPSGGLGLGYNLGLGNGRGPNVNDPGQAGDVDNNRAWVVNFYSRPTRVNGLQIGASVYHDRVFPASPTGLALEPFGLGIPHNLPDAEPAPVPSGASFNELIASAHAVWIRNGPELMAEFANVRHSVPGGEFNSPAFYLQAAYRLPWAQKHLKPYYRYEYLRSPLGDPVLERVSRAVNLRLHTLGLRYDIAEFAAFKLEYRHEFDPQNINGIGPRRFDGAFAQTAFTF